MRCHDSDRSCDRGQKTWFSEYREKRHHMSGNKLCYIVWYKSKHQRNSEDRKLLRPGSGNEKAIEYNTESNPSCSRTR